MDLDYTPTSEQVTFTNISLLQCINITIISDDITERDEFFSLTIASDDPAVQFNQSMAAVQIIDSDNGE